MRASPSQTMTADFLLANADIIYTCEGEWPRVGARQAEASPTKRASIAARDGDIVFVGSHEECSRVVQLEPDATVIDCAGPTVIPGFVDPHTHVIFAGDRRDELQRRLAGATYAEIAAAGGGIVRTVAATRTASEDELVEQA